MRRHAFIFALATLPWLTPTLPAQETAATPAPAVQSIDAEDAKALRARIDDLTAANDSLQTNVAKLRMEVQRLSEEVGKPDRNKDAAHAETIEQLKAAIKAVDDKRLAEQKNIMAEFERLQENVRKIIEKGPSSGRPTPPPVVRNNGNGNTNPVPPKGDEKLSTYQIRDGDTLSSIVADLRKHGMKVNMSQVMDVNPGVKWTSLRIGQSIYVPVKPQ